MTFTRGEEHPFLGLKLAQEKTFPEQMAWLIDQEIKCYLSDSEKRSHGDRYGAQKQA